MSKKYTDLSSVLKRLLFEKDMRSVDLARAVNLPPPTIHRLVTGKSTRPYKSSLEPIADYFGITVDQLLGEKPRAEKSSSKINQNQPISAASQIRQLPIIPWDKLSLPNQPTDNPENYLPFLGQIGEKGFATYMPDSSMEPVFSKGHILILDPEKTPRDRSFVLVKLHDAPQPIFRQLLVDLEHQYLKSLNPDLTHVKMRLLNTQDEIQAVLVEARQVYEET